MARAIRRGRSVTAKRLHAMIVDALRYPDFPTSEVLLAMLVARPGYERKTHHAPRFRRELAALVKAGRIWREFDEDIGKYRYRVPVPGVRPTMARPARKVRRK